MEGGGQEGLSIKRLLNMTAEYFDVCYVILSRYQFWVGNTYTNSFVEVFKDSQKSSHCSLQGRLRGNLTFLYKFM